ncbi:MAG: hypothetical protein ACLR23_24315 [Clostridia bacterium]
MKGTDVNQSGYGRSGKINPFGFDGERMPEQAASKAEKENKGNHGCGKASGTQTQVLLHGQIG